MGMNTKIAWCENTFSPWEGCQVTSPGCAHCYAKDRDERWHDGKHWGKRAPRYLHTDSYWHQPLRWDHEARVAGTRPRVFCASLCDVFEDRRDLDPWRERLWGLIGETPHLAWLLLTKRPQHMIRLTPPSWHVGWPENVWAGTTAEDQERADERIPELVRVPARVRFLSCEPLLGPINLGLMGILPRTITGSAYVPLHERLHQVIIGGESGAKARPCEVAWIRSLVEQCREASVAAFVKQLGAQPVYRNRWEMSAATFHDADANGWDENQGPITIRPRDAKGSDLSSFPEDLRIREVPGRAAHV